MRRAEGSVTPSKDKEEEEEAEADFVVKSPSSTPLKRAAACPAPSQALLARLGSQSVQKKFKAAASQQPVPSAPPASDNGSACAICFEPWTADGPHCICSLSCGHCFGYQCIKKWINAKERKREKGECPLCKKRAAPKDIRLLYGFSTISVLDKSAKDSLELKFHNERSKRISVEAQMLQLKRQLEEHKSDMEMLKRKLETTCEKFATYKKRIEKESKAQRDDRAPVPRSPFTILSKPAVPRLIGNNVIIGSAAKPVAGEHSDAVSNKENANYISGKESEAAATAVVENSNSNMSADLDEEDAETMEILRIASEGVERRAKAAAVHSERPLEFELLCGAFKVEGGKCLAVDTNSGIAFVVGSKERSRFGVWKSSLRAGGQSQFVPLKHEGLIRDIKCSPFPGSFNVMTASADRTLQLHHSLSNNFVTKYQFDQPAWSCLFHPSDANYIFAGLGNGEVSLCDLRKNNTELGRIAAIGRDNAPIHSLSFVQRMGMQTSDELFCASSTSQYRWFLTPELIRSSAIKLNLPPGDCASCSFEPLSRTFVASYRKAALVNRLAHVVFRIDQQITKSDKVKELRTCVGPKESHALFRTDIFTLSQSCAPVYLCALDESTRESVLWDISSGKVVLRLNAHERVAPVDVRAYRLGGPQQQQQQQQIVASLSDTELLVYTVKNC